MKAKIEFEIEYNDVKELYNFLDEIKMRVCKYEVINEVALTDEEISSYAISNKEAYHEELDECPECGTVNRWDGTYCEKCGYEHEYEDEDNELDVLEYPDHNITQDVIDAFSSDPYGENHYDEEQVETKTDIGGGFFKKSNKITLSLAESFDNYLDSFDPIKYMALGTYLRSEGVNMDGLISTSLSLRDHTALETKIRKEIKLGNVKKKDLKKFLNS
jgi:ribosomal protein L40E